MAEEVHWPLCLNQFYFRRSLLCKSLYTNFAMTIVWAVTFPSFSRDFTKANASECQTLQNESANKASLRKMELKALMWITFSLGLCYNFGFHQSSWHFWWWKTTNAFPLTPKNESNLMNYKPAAANFWFFVRKFLYSVMINVAVAKSVSSSDHLPVSFTMYNI